MIVEIPLSQDKTAYISARQFEKVSKHKWFAFWSGKGWYAIANIHGRTVLLHRFIMDRKTGDGMQIDHIDGDGLNCVDSNLRLATNQQNSFNQKKAGGMTSKYKGVSWDNWKCKWVVYIKINGRNKNLGRFNSEEEAAKAYDKAAVEFFGEFARLNFPREGVILNR
jgi:hypothetical protein